MTSRHTSLRLLARSLLALSLVLYISFLGRPIAVLASDTGASSPEPDGGAVDTETRPASPREATFKPINLSDQNFPLLSQSFPNISIAVTSSKRTDQGADKLLEETRLTVLQGINVTELYLYKGDFNLNNSLLVFQVKLVRPKGEERPRASESAQ